MGGKDRLPVTGDAAAIVTALVARARAAQGAFDDPEHNRALSELAVGDTGLGNVKDKMAKNRRKTMGLLRDLAGVKSVGVIAAEPEKGLVEIARPAVIVAPSPKGASTLSLLLSYIHAELDRVGAPLDLVQQVPSPVTREITAEL